jgi:hypothetical protein
MLRVLRVVEKVPNVRKWVRFELRRSTFFCLSNVIFILRQKKNPQILNRFTIFPDVYTNAGLPVPVPSSSRSGLVPGIRLFQSFRGCSGHFEQKKFKKGSEPINSPLFACR